MNGLEQITGAILEEARADAEKQLSLAREEAQATLASAKTQAQRVTEEAAHARESRVQALIAQEESAAGAEDRRAVLSARMETVGEAYRQAMAEMTQMPDGERLDFCIGLLQGALASCKAEREAHARLYGEEPPLPELAAILSRKDRAAFGEQLLTRVRKEAGECAAYAEKLVLAPAGDFAGGLILRMGDVESNGTLEMLLAQHRKAYTTRVFRMLYPEKG